MLLSINQLREITGRDRKTITKKLENLSFMPGEKSAHLYESTQALPLVYSVDNLEAARAKQALSQASLNAVREEDLRKQRIPIQIILEHDGLGLSSDRFNAQGGKGQKTDCRTDQ